MAVSTSIWHDDNAIVGVPQVGAEVDIHQKDSTPKFAIGTIFRRSDGAEFRYSHFGAVCSKAGLLVSQDFSESGTTLIDNIIVAPASCTKPGGETINPGDIGSRYVQAKLGGATQDEYAGGYFCVLDGTGESFTYRIRGNTAAGTPTTGQCWIEFYEPIVIALDATSDIAIVGNKYANLESANAGTDEVIAGVTCTPITDTTSVYAWVQTKGRVAVLQDASVAQTGSACYVSIATAGACTRNLNLPSIHNKQSVIVGYMITPGASTEWSLIELNV